jgi:hypothetical protein
VNRHGSEEAKHGRVGSFGAAAVENERLDADEYGAEFASVRGAPLAVGVNEAQGASKRILLGGIAGRIDGQESDFRGTAHGAVVLQAFFLAFDFFFQGAKAECASAAYVDRRVTG